MVLPFVLNKACPASTRMDWSPRPELIPVIATGLPRATGDHHRNSLDGVGSCNPAVAPRGVC